ncbi:oxidoreductase [Actinokineospora globicatena]|uniref:oxidoreductase n=1 Tax=Actinokineospora globicatena TaxID=103729 RepID=UPI0020A264F5|nr:oxidoreductase [Actinokineospora globicatena]MCP2306565.1 putative oxidoreductase [Actinokineospora globicatena]GLW81996.1 oxidoreductase [Actinokineospora globicatena]GLW88790.1 oxidoreductase [Actinokineospora globicatena]
MSALGRVKRVGYGAMQLAGPGVFGPPADPDGAVAVLRRAVELGVDHIDTSDYYGPYVVNELIARALRPYPEDLVIVTKVGARRDDTGNWLPALSADELRSAVHDNLNRLGVDRLDVVNLRVMDDSPLEESFTALAALREEGLIAELGISNVTLDQLATAREIAPVACVQNHYNITERGDDPVVDETNRLGIAYVPFFPLGGFQPIQAEALHTVAARHGATDRQVALAWLLARSPNILLIPGTKTPAHLEQNVAVGDLALTPADLAELDAIAG